MKQFVKKYREAAGLTQQELSEKTAIPLKTIQDWEQTGRSPRDMQRLVPVADVLSCTVDDLLGRHIPKNAIKIKPATTAMIPVYGSISAGTPMDIIEYFCIAEAPAAKISKHPNAFYLKVSGDSMDRELLDGHLAMIDPDSEVKNGDTVAVIVNGHDATLKVLFQTANHIILSPNSKNPEHKDIIIDKLDPGEDQVRIVGKKVFAVYPDPDMIDYLTTGSK